ncbi:UNVERIFIED_CONTAM: hypothetical protein FKN15_053643 [Acipenser sinensis]
MLVLIASDENAITSSATLPSTLQPATLIQEPSANSRAKSRSNTKHLDPNAHTKNEHMDMDTRKKERKKERKKCIHVLLLVLTDEFVLAQKTDSLFLSPLLWV